MVVNALGCGAHVTHNCMKTDAILYKLKYNL